MIDFLVILDEIGIDGSQCEVMELDAILHGEPNIDVFNGLDHMGNPK